jgi:MFS family permease
MKKKTENETAENAEDQVASTSTPTLKRVRKKSTKKTLFERRLDRGIHLLWAFIALGFAATVGGLIASSTNVPQWFQDVLVVLGVALRIALLTGVLAFIVWCIRSVRRHRASGAKANSGRSRFDYQKKPIQSTVVLISGVTFLLAGPIGILYYFLLPTTFIPSAELRGFYYVSSAVIIAAGLGLGIMIFWMERHLFAKVDSALKDKAIVLFMPIAAPLLLMVSWMFFMSGPVSYTLHLLAEKETKTVIASVARGTSSGTADFMCGGFWTAELQDHSFWWPRRVCNIDLKTMRALEKGGTIKLRGKVSRFGIDVDTYAM